MGKEKLGHEGTEQANERLDRSAVCEIIRENSDVAFFVANEVADILGHETIGKEDFSASLEKKINEWKNNGTIDYYVKQLELDPNYSMTLVARPNVDIEGGDIKKLADKLGIASEVKNLIHQYPKNRSLSDIVGNDPFVLSLVSDKPSKEGSDVLQQRANLKEIQNSECTVASYPSTFEAMCYVFNRISVGGSAKFSIRDVCAPVKEIGGNNVVPVVTYSADPDSKEISVGFFPADGNMPVYLSMR